MLEKYDCNNEISRQSSLSLINTEAEEREWLEFLWNQFQNFSLPYFDFFKYLNMQKNKFIPACTTSSC